MKIIEGWTYCDGYDDEENLDFNWFYILQYGCESFTTEILDKDDFEVILERI